VVSELGGSQISTLLETLPGIANVLRSPVADALGSVIRAAARLTEFNIADAEELPSDVAHWEPTTALRAGPTGLEDIERIVSGAPLWLVRPGALVVEIAPHQADRAVALARAAGAVDAAVLPDLAGRSRVLVARWC